jgi:hypothetical protein
MFYRLGILGLMRDRDFWMFLLVSLVASWLMWFVRAAASNW